MDGTANAVLALAPDGFELHPRRGDVDGAERAEVEAFGAAPTVSHQIHFAEPGARVVPLGEGADRDLVPEPAARVRDGRPPVAVPGAGGRPQPREGRAAGLLQSLLEVGRHGELAASTEALEQLGHEGVEPMGADPAARLPEDLGRGGDLWTVLARAAARPGGR